MNLFGVVKKILPVLILSLCILFTGLFCVFFLLLVTIENEGIEEERATNFFKLRSYDPQANETTLSFVSTYKDLDGDQSVSFESNGIYYMISDFESNEYVCTGTCFCEPESQERRNAIIPSLKGLTYLLVAGTSFLAYKQAKEYFGDACEQQYKNYCPMNSIKSDVEKCTPLGSQIEKEQTEEEGTSENHEGKNMYYCHGLCIMNMNWIYYEEEYAYRKEIWEDDNLTEDIDEAIMEYRDVCCEIHVKLTLDINQDLSAHKNRKLLEKHPNLREENEEHYAELFFASGELDDVCRSRSRRIVKMEGRKDEYGIDTCVGYSPPAPFPLGKHEQTFCYKVEKS